VDQRRGERGTEKIRKKKLHGRGKGKLRAGGEAGRNVRLGGKTSARGGKKYREQGRRVASQEKFSSTLLLSKSWMESHVTKQRPQKTGKSARSVTKGGRIRVLRYRRNGPKQREWQTETTVVPGDRKPGCGQKKWARGVKSGIYLKLQKLKVSGR